MTAENGVQTAMALAAAQQEQERADIVAFVESALAGDLEKFLSSLQRLGVAEQLPVPGQEFVEALGRVILQVGQHVGQPGKRIDVVELGGLDQGVDRGGAPAALVGAGERPVAPSRCQPRTWSDVDGLGGHKGFGGTACRGLRVGVLSTGGSTFGSIKVS
jgi:hypothetical protein